MSSLSIACAVIVIATGSTDTVLGILLPKSATAIRVHLAIRACCTVDVIFTISTLNGVTLPPFSRKLRTTEPQQPRVKSPMPRQTTVVAEGFS